MNKPKEIRNNLKMKNTIKINYESTEMKKKKKKQTEEGNKILKRNKI
jgi:hypothetical protein